MLVVRSVTSGHEEGGMVAPKHELLTVIGELSAKLAARSRHVCLLLGAGASVGAGLPDLANLTSKVLASMNESERALLEPLLKGRNLEQALTRLRRIESLVEADETIGGLDKPTSRQLDVKICAAIIDAIRSPNRLDAFNRFGAWANRADYRRPLEVFTTNYDLLIEGGLEHIGASYFDGFVGNIKGQFRPDLVEAIDSASAETLPSSFVRLWKLHGSSNWEWRTQDGHRRVVRLGDHAEAGTAVAIYPSDEKYDDSRRVPFVVLMDRFRRALAEPETLLIVSGYSFSDQHINEIIFEAARRRPRSEFIALCYSKIPNTLREVARETKNVTAFGTDEAVIGGQLGAWSAPDDVAGIAEDGKCRLGDFGCLAAFLDRQNQPTAAPSVIGT